MSSQRVNNGIPEEEGSGNVYADLGYAQGEEMMIKAQLVTMIAEIIQQQGLTRR